MKNLITPLCLIACLFFGNLTAQQITDMEYFFNSDPGIGNGNPVDLTNTANLDIDYTFPLDGLSFGLHTIYIRLKDNNGNWSLSQAKQFLYFEGNTTSEIDGIEYFIDEDPGIGQAIQLDLPNSPVLNQAVNLNLSSFEPGFHILYIRVKDTNGSYSLAMAKPIVIADGNNNNNTIAAIEYFLNDDPGHGNGQQIALNNSEFIDAEIELDLGSAPVGIHQLFMRLKDNYGMWSHTFQHQVVVFPGLGSPENITQVEYFYDEDPGIGNGLQVNVDVAVLDSSLTILVPESLSLGEHTLYVRVKDRQGRWSLLNTDEIFACPGGPAIAGFRPIRFGNTISFVDTASNVLFYDWDFGDGTTSNLSNPIHEFGFGDFTITQIVENGCNSDTATYFVEIKGVESFTPEQAGLGGDIAMIIYGGGFDENTTIELTNGSTTISPYDAVAVSNTEYNALLDFHLVETGGFYDLIINIDGIAPIVIEDALFLNDAQYPECIATIEGPSDWRSNRNTNFNLVVENPGNINAKAVPVFLVVPNSVSVTFLVENEYFRYDTTQAFYYFDTINQTLYDINYDEVKDIIRGMRFEYMEVDSFNGQPFAARIYDLLIPNIPGNTTMSIPFRAISSSTGSKQLKAFAANLNIFGSPAAPQWYDQMENVGTMALDQAYNIADESNNTWAQALLGTAKAGREHLKLTAQYYGMKAGGLSSDEAFGRVYGGGQLDAANAYALKTAGEVMVDRGISNMGSIDAANIAKMQSRSKHMAERILKSSDVGMRNMRQKMQDRFLDEIRDAATETGRREALWKAYKGINDANDSYEYLTKTLAFLESCPELKHLEEEILEEINSMLGQEEENTKPTNVITSTDPNAIYGPQGYNADYIKNNRNAHYIVTFENVDTATAPAQIVEIYDTLDLTVLDAATFEFSHVVIGEDIIRFPSKRQQYVTEFDMRPDKDIIVRINATFDDSSGVAYWKFMSLDPETGDLIDDALDGFLNPNVNAPEGEGSVSYNVKVKANLSHNTAFTNRASIIFDDNEAILTNNWDNTIDDIAPVTQLSDDFDMVSDSSILIHFEGFDDGSGIKFYEVFISNDNETFIPYALSFGESIPFYRGSDSVYYLYCIATDSVGNKQIKNTADIMVMFSPTAVVQNLVEGESVLVYPNPNKGAFFIQSKLKAAQNIRLQISDLQGRMVYQTIIQHPGGEFLAPVIADKISKGMFAISLTDENGNIMMTDKIIIQ
jgi:PKD repeat protein